MYINRTREKQNKYKQIRLMRKDDHQQEKKNDE
jgi:hypothetical protein